MCCSEIKTNRINVEEANERIEIRKGRWLRILLKKPDNLSSSNQAFANAVQSSAIRVNSCLASGGENQTLSETTEASSLAQSTNKIVIFFVHGVGGSSNIWSEQIEYLSKLGYVIVAPDVLGHGGSSTPQDPSSYEFSELSNDMFAVFDRYRSEKKNVLVGHSYGCSFCTMIAHQRPCQVSKMILISGGGPVPLNPKPCQLFCLPSCILACLNPVVSWSFRRMGFDSQGQHNNSVQSTHAFKVPSHVLRATMMGQTWNEGDEQFHSEIMVATLLIYGNHDSFVSLEEETYMRETIYGSRLEVLDNVGHMVMLESPQKLNELILQFLCQDMSTVSETLLTGNNRGCSSRPDG